MIDLSKMNLENIDEKYYRVDESQGDPVGINADSRDIILQEKSHISKTAKGIFDESDRIVVLPEEADALGSSPPPHAAEDQDNEAPESYDQMSISPQQKHDPVTIIPADTSNATTKIAKGIFDESDRIVVLPEEADALGSSPPPHAEDQDDEADSAFENNEMMISPQQILHDEALVAGNTIEFDQVTIIPADICKAWFDADGPTSLRLTRTTRRDIRFRMSLSRPRGPAADNAFETNILRALCVLNHAANDYDSHLPEVQQLVARKKAFKIDKRLKVRASHYAPSRIKRRKRKTRQACVSDWKFRMMISNLDPVPDPVLDPVPDPEPEDSALPDPEPEDSAVPDPEPKESAVPDPEPEEEFQDGEFFDAEFQGADVVSEEAVGHASIREVVEWLGKNVELNSKLELQISSILEKFFSSHAESSKGPCIKISKFVRRLSKEEAANIFHLLIVLTHEGYLKVEEQEDIATFETAMFLRGPNM